MYEFAYPPQVGIELWFDVFTTSGAHPDVTFGLYDATTPGITQIVSKKYFSPHSLPVVSFITYVPAVEKFNERSFEPLIHCVQSY